MLHPHFKSATDNTFYTARSPSLTKTVRFKMIDQSIHFYVGLRQSLHFNVEYSVQWRSHQKEKIKFAFCRNADEKN